MAILAISLPRSYAAFNDLGAGARAPGMGDAFVPVADDVYSIYYNPAGLGTLERPQFGTSYTKLFTGLTDNSELNSQFFGYAHPLRDGRYGTLGAAWNTFSLNTSVYREQSYYLSYGNLLYRHPDHGDLYAGVSLKYLKTSLNGFGEAANAVAAGGILHTGSADPALASRGRGTADADLGLLYRLSPRYALGLTGVHLLSPNVAINGTDKLPMEFKLGLNYRSSLSNLVAQYDNKKAPDGSIDHVFTAAAERWFPRLFIGDFAARAGMGLGTRDFKQLSAGLSFRTRRVEIDYAFSMAINTVSSKAGTHKMGISFRFGRALEEDESVELVLEAMRQLKYGALPTRKTLPLPKGRQTLLEEYLAQARSLEAQAQYREALDKLSMALTVAPADKDLVARFGRLNFVGQQIKELALFKTDAEQATLHQGLLAYIAGSDLEAVAKVSEALNLKPEDRELDAFLTQLELVTGLKRMKVRPPKDYAIATLLTRASSAIEERDYEQAISLSKEILALDADNASAWQNLGTAYFARGEFDRSYEAWQKAYGLEKSPAIREAISGYLRSISRARKSRPARVEPRPEPAAGRPALSLEEIQKLFNEGVDDYIKRDLEGAKKAFEKILAADPNNVEARKALRRVEEERP